MTRCADPSSRAAGSRSSTSYDEVSMRIARAASVFRRRDKHLPEGLLTWMLRWLLGGGGAAASSSAAARTAERKKQLLFARRMIERQNTNRKQTHKDQCQSEAEAESAAGNDYDSSTSCSSGNNLESLLLRAALECFFTAASPFSTHAAPPRRARESAALDEAGGQLTPEKIMKHLAQEIEVDLKLLNSTNLLKAEQQPHEAKVQVPFFGLLPQLHAAEQLLSLAVAAGTITTFTDAEADGEPKSKTK